MSSEWINLKTAIYASNWGALDSSFYSPKDNIALGSYSSWCLNSLNLTFPSNVLIGYYIWRISTYEHFSHPSWCFSVMKKLCNIYFRVSSLFQSKHELLRKIIHNQIQIYLQKEIDWWQPVGQSTAAFHTFIRLPRLSNSRKS